MSSPFRAVLFDLDGTLIETHIDFASMKRDMLHLAASVGLPEAEAADRDILGIADAAAERLAASGGDVGAFRRRAWDMLEDMEVEGCANPVLLPGTIELLTTLQACGICVGVVTRNCRRVSEGLLKKFGVPHDLLLSRDDVERAKPDPQHLWDALNALGYPASASAMVGDHWMDVQAGQRAGVALTIGILGGRSPEWFAPCPPDALVRDLSEAGRLLGV